MAENLPVRTTSPAVSRQPNPVKPSSTLLRTPVHRIISGAVTRAERGPFTRTFQAGQFVFRTHAYAIKAFEQRAIDYLLKPIRLGRLFEALTRARDAVPIRTEVLRELMPEARSHLPVHERGRIILVPIEEVIYLRAEMKYVTVRTAQREYLIEESLTALEKEYAARFVRIHRSCLAAIAAIAGFEKGGEEGESGWLLKLRGLDERLPISRRQWASVKALDEANGQGV